MLENNDQGFVVMQQKSLAKVQQWRKQTNEVQ